MKCYRTPVSRTSCSCGVVCMPSRLCTLLARCRRDPRSQYPAPSIPRHVYIAILWIYVHMAHSRNRPAELHKIPEGGGLTSSAISADAACICRCEASSQYVNQRGGSDLHSPGIWEVVTVYGSRTSIPSSFLHSSCDYPQRASPPTNPVPSRVSSFSASFDFTIPPDCGRGPRYFHTVESRCVSLSLCHSTLALYLTGRPPDALCRHSMVWLRETWLRLGMIGQVPATLWDLARMRGLACHSGRPRACVATVPPVGTLDGGNACTCSLGHGAWRTYLAAAGIDTEDVSAP